MSGRFANRSAIVTGAASGIGRATARLLAAEGARVVAVDLSEAVLDIGDGLANIVPFQANAGIEEEVAGMIAFALALSGVVLFLIYFQTPLQMSELVWFPVVVLVQLILTLGFALILSALTVHFRDIKDILANVMTLWFFITPIIYSWKNPPSQIRRFLDLNPFTHLAISYQEILYFDGPFGHVKWLLALGVGSIGLFVFGYFLFDRLRDSFAEEV